MAELPERTVAIDEDGFAVSGDLRVQDETAGLEILSQLEIAENGAYVSRFGGVPVLVEAFSEPLVAHQVDRIRDEWVLLFPYGHQAAFDPGRLHVDEWDRFRGRTVDRIPFVLSRKAQAMFFDLVDSFDDDAIVIDGREIAVPETYDADPAIEDPEHWTAVYETEGRPGWDQGGPAEPLKDMLSRLKLTRCRILVPGCGEGHDAAFFAKEGHFVTAVDFSAEAIRRAKDLYGHISGLEFIQSDLFEFDPGPGTFDVVFEHTCYCAIPPDRRQELIRRWLHWLSPGGHLMGVFFAVEKRKGPPFGGTEWELRERLKKNFRFLFWGRWKKSAPKRQGKELFVYAQKM